MPPPNHPCIQTLDCRPEGPLLPVYRYESLPSTNRTAGDLSATGLTPPFAVTARQQTAGRGQWGRTWESQLGGLYLSVAIATPPPKPSNQTAPFGLPLTLATAWGIATILREIDIPVALKWPNDLLLNQRKLGGILCQQRQRGQTPSTEVVVGVGINWDNSVPPTAIALKPYLERIESTAIASQEQLLHRTLCGIFLGCDRVAREGLASLLADYQKMLTSLDRMITINERAGTVIGVDPNGRLGIRFSDTGEVTFYNPGTIGLGYPPCDTSSP